MQSASSNAFFASISSLPGSDICEPALFRESILRETSLLFHICRFLNVCEIWRLQETAASVYATFHRDSEALSDLWEKTLLGRHSVELVAQVAQLCRKNGVLLGEVAVVSFLARCPQCGTESATESLIIEALLHGGGANALPYTTPCGGACEARTALCWERLKRTAELTFPLLGATAIWPDRCLQEACDSVNSFSPIFRTGDDGYSIEALRRKLKGYWTEAKMNNGHSTYHEHHSLQRHLAPSSCSYSQSSSGPLVLGCDKPFNSPLLVHMRCLRDPGIKPTSSHDPSHERDTQAEHLPPQGERKRSLFRGSEKLKSFFSRRSDVGVSGRLSVIDGAQDGSAASEEFSLIAYVTDKAEGHRGKYGEESSENETGSASYYSSTTTKACETHRTESRDGVVRRLPIVYLLEASAGVADHNFHVKYWSNVRPCQPSTGAPAKQTSALSRLASRGSKQADITLAGAISASSVAYEVDECLDGSGRRLSSTGLSITPDGLAVCGAYGDAAVSVDAGFLHASCLPNVPLRLSDELTRKYGSSFRVKSLCVWAPYWGADWSHLHPVAVARAKHAHRRLSRRSSKLTGSPGGSDPTPLPGSPAEVPSHLHSSVTMPVVRSTSQQKVPKCLRNADFLRSFLGESCELLQSQELTTSQEVRDSGDETGSDGSLSTSDPNDEAVSPTESPESPGLQHQHSLLVEGLSDQSLGADLMSLAEVEVFNSKKDANVIHNLVAWNRLPSHPRDWPHADT